jgi:inosose dehydratase
MSKIRDVPLPVIAALDRTRESSVGAVIKRALTALGDGGLDLEASVKRLTSYVDEGWLVAETEQNPIHNPRLDMAKIGRKELLRVMAVAGNEVIRSRIGTPGRMVRIARHLKGRRARRFRTALSHASV